MTFGYNKNDMATSDPVVEHNVEGRYYVDESCIYCDFCVEMAPDNFAFDQKEYAYVSKQPDCHAEHERMSELIDGCPTESIGDRLQRHEEAIDDMGLGVGSTPKSLSGGIFQMVARWFTKLE